MDLCDTCDGTGVAPDYSGSPFGAPRERECPACSGTGRGYSNAYRLSEEDRVTTTVEDAARWERERAEAAGEFDDYRPDPADWQ